MTPARRRALVTGASRGIGRALARALAEDGADVAIHARSPEALDGTLAELSGLGGRVAIAAGELASAEDAAAVAAAAEEALGGIDVLVNNAGGGLRGPLLEIRPDEMTGLFAVNVTACLALAQVVVPGMMARGWGRVINLGSPYGRVPSPDLGAYCVSKAALEMLTKSMALEWAGTGVTANALAPVQTLTDLTRATYEDLARRSLVDSQIPLGRWCTTDDLLGALRLLTSDDSAMITGQVLMIDGGRLLI